GTLTEARDISNRSFIALRSVGERECQGSIFSSGANTGQALPGAAAPAAPGPAAPGGTAPPTGGAGTGAGGGTGGTTTASPGAPRRIPAFDMCMSALQMQAESTWRMAQMPSLASLSVLRQIISDLGRMRGDKTLVLISGGWPMDERDETSTLANVAAEAADARVTMFSVFVPRSTYSADRRSWISSTMRDNYLYSGPLETLASMTGGESFQAEVGA